MSELCHIADLTDTALDSQGPSDYDNVTPLEWAEYEFATIEYDWKIPPKAATAIRAIMKRLSENAS